jgi:hypothetical protein
MWYDFHLRPELTKFTVKGKFPKSYEAAKKALAQCERIDECAEWANKAAALASYAKQADDSELENYARRIRLRAVRRCGELLRQFDARGGNRARRKTEAPLTFARPSRARVAQEAGLSEYKARAAASIAAIPEAEFEAAVESRRPPGTTLLRHWGRMRPTEQVRSITEKEITGFLRRGRARDAVQALIDLSRTADRFDLDAVLEMLREDPRKLELVRRGLGLALQIKGGLDRAGLRGNPKLRLIDNDPAET